MAGNHVNIGRRMVGVEGLLGREIVDLEGRFIGELHDIVLDVETGRIAHVFIALNAPRYSDQRVLAPWDALHVEAETQRLRLNTRIGAQERGPPMANRRFAND
ncbi:MAG: PRC-barrel domain-containing protein [Casimicrobiaceae bacterium]